MVYNIRENWSARVLMVVASGKKGIRKASEKGNQDGKLKEHEKPNPAWVKVMCWGKNQKFYFWLADRVNEYSIGKSRIHPSFIASLIESASAS